MADASTSTEATSEDNSKPPGDVDDFDDDASDKKLGEAGQRALAAERAARSRAEREAKTVKAELDKLRAGSQTENEKAITKAREEAKAEALAEVRLERAQDKVAVRAGKVEVTVDKDKLRFADPDDAALHLGDLSRFVEQDGSIDTKAIDRELTDLLKRKPYLAGANGQRPRGGGDGGARGTGGGTPGMNDLIRQGAGYR